MKPISESFSVWSEERVDSLFSFRWVLTHHPSTALEKITEKQSSKAEIILSAIMSDLVSNHGVNKDHVLSKDTEKKISVHVRVHTNILVTLRPPKKRLLACSIRCV